ncbi:MAG TPA: hypothetical protein PLN78_08025, partial [Pseudomonadales bacterium]|nr:hypothetical protein [Pseudomonadales bacterium]
MEFIITHNLRDLHDPTASRQCELSTGWHGAGTSLDPEWIGTTCVQHMVSAVSVDKVRVRVERLAVFPLQQSKAIQMLAKSRRFAGVTGPVVTVVMDGVGARASRVGNAVADAHTPTLDRLFANHPHIELKAHGTAVG